MATMQPNNSTGVGQHRDGKRWWHLLKGPMQLYQPSRKAPRNLSVRSAFLNNTVNQSQPLNPTHLSLQELAQTLVTAPRGTQGTAGSCSRLGLPPHNRREWLFSSGRVCVTDNRSFSARWAIQPLGAVSSWCHQQLNTTSTRFTNRNPWTLGWI